MAWVKLDDAMPTHPKLMAAGPVAFALDVAGICYSNKHATDGFIANYALLAVFPGLATPKKVAAKLVEVGRWAECDGGWLIHDVHDYQPTADHQKEVSKKRAEAGRKGGSKSSRSLEADAKQSAKQSAKQVASDPDNPVPSRPDKGQEPPPGDGKPFVGVLADELRDEFGCEFSKRDTLYQAFHELLSAALERLPEDRHRTTSMGVIAAFVERAQDMAMTKEARSHTARLVNTHSPLDVLHGYGEALAWGAGIGADYANDPLSLSKYVAGVLSKAKRGAA